MVQKTSIKHQQKLASKTNKKAQELVIFFDTKKKGSNINFRVKQFNSPNIHCL